MSTLLILGETDTAAAPSSGAAQLFLLGASFGNATGTDQTLLVETQDQPVVGRVTRALWRRVVIVFERTGACTLRVTPIANFTQEQAATEASFDSPATVTTDTLVVPVSVTCVYGRVRIEVVSRDGAVRLMGCDFRARPLASEMLNG